MHRISIIIISVFTSLFIVSCADCQTKSNDISVINNSSNRVEMSNAALKKLYEIGEPDLPKLKKMLSEHNFEGLEKYYEDLFQKYKKDAQYEWLLKQSYNYLIWSKGTWSNDVSLEDLDLWVSSTKSYIAYAARGQYKTQLGFSSRGVKFISETSSNQLTEMQRFFNEAVKDLQIVITKNPSFMPAYSSLLNMAMASNMPFTAKQILDEAEQNDKRTFYVRADYMNSLKPKWGGSYEEMAAFAQHAIKYVVLNPKLWSLQGEADADRAVNYGYGEHNYSAAVELFATALKYGDRVQWLRDSAIFYIELQQLSKAVPYLKKVNYYDPNDKWARDSISISNRISNSKSQPKIGPVQ